MKLANAPEEKKSASEKRRRLKGAAKRKSVPKTCRVGRERCGISTR